MLREPNTSISIIFVSPVLLMNYTIYPGDNEEGRQMCDIMNLPVQGGFLS
jgi:hypothetical protein